MLTYYPEIKPYKERLLSVDNIHTLYIEESGNPTGIPILYVHGGPGGGCQPDNRRYFDPSIYRIILFDQRGCGLSTPHAELKNNTTHALIQDLEKIREELGITSWILFGGSWGTTLSLLYAETYPERVQGLILRGIFLARPQDTKWLYEEGLNRIFPEQWEEFKHLIPTEEQAEILQAYYQRLTGEDDLARMAAAKAWSLWEGSCCTLQPQKQVMDFFSSPHVALAISRIECHYFMNEFFIETNQILKNIHKIQQIPGIIIHGRYDMVCPCDNAWELHKAWPKSELDIIRDAGHSASELGIIDALVRATNNILRPV